MHWRTFTHLPSPNLSLFASFISINATFRIADHYLKPYLPKNLTDESTLSSRNLKRLEIGASTLLVVSVYSIFRDGFTGFILNSVSRSAVFATAILSEETLEEALSKFFSSRDASSDYNKFIGQFSGVEQEKIKKVAETREELSKLNIEIFQKKGKFIFQMNCYSENERQGILKELTDFLLKDLFEEFEKRGSQLKDFLEDLAELPSDFSSEESLEQEFQKLRGQLFRVIAAAPREEQNDFKELLEKREAAERAYDLAREGLETFRTQSKK